MRRWAVAVLAVACGSTRVGVEGAGEPDAAAAGAGSLSVASGTDGGNGAEGGSAGAPGGAGGGAGSGGTAGLAGGASGGVDAGADGSDGSLTDAAPDVAPDAPAGTNDACPGELLELGSTPGVTPDRQRTSGTCGGHFWVDAVYRFTAPADGALHLTLVSVDFDAVLHVRTDCMDQYSEIACSNNVGTGISETLDVPMVAGATVYVWVDGAAVDGQTFELIAVYGG